MSKNNYQILSPEFGLEKGGIQSWAYYIGEMLRSNNRRFNVFSYKEFKLSSFFSLIFGYFSEKTYILMTWKMFIFIFPLLVFGRYIRPKVFIIVHGNEFLNLNVIQKAILKCLISKSYVKLIANSHSISKLFEHELGYLPDRVFYPFVECPNADGVSEYSGHTNFEIKLCTITRLVERKNLSNVISAIAELKDEGVDISYIVGGSGSEYSTLTEQVKKLNLSDRVKFLGVIQESIKWEVLKSSDAFILPSLFDKKSGSIEGYGIVYVEANAMGIPNISGNSGGAVEAVINDITGFHTDGSVCEIKKSIYDLKSMDIDKYKLIEHSKNHSVNNNLDFLYYLDNNIKN